MSFTNRKRRPSIGTTSLRPSPPGKGRPRPRKSASEPASSLPFERATVRLTGRLRRRSGPARRPSDERGRGPGLLRGRNPAPSPPGEGPRRGGPPGAPGAGRSEEHTSELQSRRDLVCRLLLEKKNNTA